MNNGPRLFMSCIQKAGAALTECEEILPANYPDYQGKDKEPLGKEAWLEQALVTRPDLLLLDRIDSQSGKPMLIGRQLNFPDRGTLDLLFLEATGVLTLVETKLVKNHEARREVLAQILDYASCLAEMSFEDLEESIFSPAQPLENQEPKDLVAAIWKFAGHGEPKGDGYNRWSDEFKRRVTDNLRRRCLRLLIIADHIDHRLRDILAFTVGGARPDFQIALVEIPLYTFGALGERHLVVPTVHWSWTPSIQPIDPPTTKIQWTEDTFLKQTRFNNAGDQVTIEMVEHILRWMKHRVQDLDGRASLQWSRTSPGRPSVNRRYDRWLLAENLAEV